MLHVQNDVVSDTSVHCLSSTSHDCKHVATKDSPLCGSEQAGVIRTVCVRSMVWDGMIATQFEEATCLNVANSRRPIATCTTALDMEQMASYGTSQMR